MDWHEPQHIHPQCVQAVQVSLHIAKCAICAVIAYIDFIDYKIAIAKGSITCHNVILYVLTSYSNKSNCNRYHKAVHLVRGEQYNVFLDTIFTSKFTDVNSSHLLSLRGLDAFSSPKQSSPSKLKAVFSSMALN